MSFVFADTCYWIAVLSPRDQLHGQAIEASNRLGAARLLTTEMVLTEFANTFSKSSSGIRVSVVKTIRDIRLNINVKVIPQTSQLFTNALKLYEERPDKSWSLTDCASMLVMGDNEVTKILTSDRHFEQAGFVRLLQVA